MVSSRDEAENLGKHGVAVSLSDHGIDWHGCKP
jgi:hypothetical protein